MTVLKARKKPRKPNVRKPCDKDGIGAPKGAEVTSQRNDKVKRGIDPPHISYLRVGLQVNAKEP
jgi:hypothetical protein